MPLVTVVVPTAGRVALTRACLESILVATAADGVQAEVLVVDSSPPHERVQLESICLELGAEILSSPVSVSVKRNLGAKHAKAEYVMFLDSDCAITPGCLAAHLATLRDPAVDASQGTVIFRGLEGLAFRTVRCSGILNAFKPPDGKSLRSVASANLMVRRASFLKVCFDPRLGPPGLGGEDVDFGLRLTAQGSSVIGSPTAIAYHDTETWNGFRLDARRFLAWGRSEALLIERHSSMSYLDMPSPVLVALLLCVASAIAALRSWVAVFAFPAGLLTYVGFMAVAGARDHPSDRIGGALSHWVFLVLDLGRVWESLRLGRPAIALRRLRFSEDQVSQEWPDLVPTSWALWFMTLVGTVLQWWALT